MERLLERHLLPLAREALGAFPVLVIQGARQVGKSTFAQMLVADRPARAFTLDDAESLTAARADPRAFADQAPDRTLVIDEIQRAPELILAIKASVDRNRAPGRFVLTGSSDLLRLERTPDSLAGRATTLRLHGFSQGEIAGHTDDFVARLASATPAPSYPAYPSYLSKWTRADYVAVLARGGYPEVQRLTGRLRSTWLDSYLERIIQRDALDVQRLTAPDRLASLIRLVAANQAGELVKARIAGQANIPATTISTYLHVLETLFLVSTLSPWTPNLTRREVGRPKAMVADSALAMRLSRLTEEQLLPLTGSDHIGGLLEALVVGELLKQTGWSEQEYELFHYRDRNGLEVDVIVELADGTIFGLEVKAAGTFRGEHFAGLRALRDRLGDRFRGGFVLNTSDAGYQYSERLWGLPISALWDY